MHVHTLSVSQAPKLRPVIICLLYCVHVAPSTRPPVKAIPRIIPHLNGKGVTLVLAPVEKTGSDWRMELVLTPANTALPPTVFQQDAGHIMSTVYGLYPGNHYRVDQIVVGEDGSKEIVASGAFHSPPARELTKPQHL